MATLIRATCGECGDVELGTRDLLVRLCEDTESGSYVFRCPNCAPVVRPADRSTIDLLVVVGLPPRSVEICRPSCSSPDRRAGPSPTTT